MSSYRLGSFLLVILVLGFWLPYSSLDDVNRGSVTADVYLSLAILEFCSLRLAWIASRGQPYLLAMTFYLFVYIWIGIAGSMQLYAWRFPWPRAHTPYDVFPGLLVVVTALIGYEAGRLFNRLRSPGTADFRPPRFMLALTPRRVLLLALISLPAAAYGVFYFGPSGLFATRATFGHGSGDRMGVLIARALLRSPSFVALLFTTYFTVRNWRSFNRSRKRLFGALLIFLVLLNMATNYPPAQARYWLGTLVLTPLFAFVPWRRFNATIWIVTMALGLLWIYPRADIFRRAPTIDAALTQLRARGDVSERIFSGDYDVLQQTINGVVYVDHFGLTWGRNLAGAVLFWYPRRFWDDKPFGTGQTVATQLSYRYTNLSAPLWMEAYIAFGWAGTFFLMSAYGYVSRVGDRAVTFALSARKTSLAVLLIPFWAAFQFYLVRGDLLNGCAHSFFAAILFVIGTRRTPIVPLSRTNPDPGRLQTPHARKGPTSEGVNRLLSKKADTGQSAHG